MCRAIFSPSSSTVKAVRFASRKESAGLRVAMESASVETKENRESEARLGATAEILPSPDLRVRKACKECLERHPISLSDKSSREKALGSSLIRTATRWCSILCSRVVRSD